MKTNALFLFHIFRLPKRDLYVWLLLESGRRRGTPADATEKEIMKAVKGGRLTPAVLKKLLADNYYNSVDDDVAEFEKLTGASILDVFDDHPLLTRFPRLRKLARNREFEIMFYGRVR